MIRKISVGILLMTMATSCVSRRLYNELDANYKKCLEDREQLLGESDGLKSKSSELEQNSESLKSQLEALQAERVRLQNLYDQLEKNSDAAIRAEIERLNDLKSELGERSQRIEDLESKLAAQDANLKRLKASLSNALNAFEGKGLTVEQKNGKVYVSMENKLLFRSGSWSVSPDGQTAVTQLGKVLAQNPDISILIEGHTDNDKILGTLEGGVNNNWDLSTKRATAIVHILEQISGIQKQNLTAAGRSEFAPVSSNQSESGKAKNRRIEVILTPKLDELSKMLHDI